jgi:hypothetical protein
MRCGPLLGLMMMFWVSASALAQVPGEAEFEAAVTVARDTAGVAGLEVRTDGLAIRQWREGLPLAAWRVGQRCHVGYIPWLATMRFAWLFPALSDADRKLWLGGLLAHEFAHCRNVEHAAAAGKATSAAQEAVADLAFALHVDQQAEAGTALIERLATLRESHARLDPSHDTHAALRCYLAQRGTVPTSHLRSLDAWKAHCVEQLFWPN